MYPNTVYLVTFVLGLANLYGVQPGRIKDHISDNNNNSNNNNNAAITSEQLSHAIRNNKFSHLSDNDDFVFSRPKTSQFSESYIREKRSQRSNKYYEFKESDGYPTGATVFSLNSNGRKDEKYELESPNRWVTVDPSGAVKVKEPWDFESLGADKTIDFWVSIKRQNQLEIERQRVSINIRDVNDEKPYFINRPLPMQAVVQLNAPPGTSVFKLQARDPDTDHNIHYFLSRDRGMGRFEVDERSGEVRTKGSEPFMLDKEYVIYVKAEDHAGTLNDRQYQSTEELRLSIVGGKRPPQFYMPKYEATIPENHPKDSDVVEVKAKSFADRIIRYTVRAQGKGAGTFNIGPTSGIVKLAKDLDYEDLRQPKQYSLLVTATEDSGGLSTSVELTIRVTDVNDNIPRFELPDYQQHNVPEDIPLGRSILKVSATDADQGKNAEIIYSIDRPEFRIDEKGIIYANGRLDADSNNTYQMTVRAIDRGDPPLTGTATVRIYTENKNDEAPKFSQDVYTPNVDENAGPSTLVTTVVASDKDGDNILFGFGDGSNKSGVFEIEERTGVIRLQSRPFTLDKDKYELNVTARDDGSCCKDGASTIHVSSTLVVVFITDVNDNKPHFNDCASYKPTAQEGASAGTHVITVKATDSDKGHNGNVRYSIVQQPNQKGTKFTIDETTGEVRTNKVFDREGDDGRFVSVTVKAVDKGSPPLEGVCSFKVEITDINDNSPLFDRQEYRENVKQDTQVGTNILRVSASDEDADNNGAILYNLTSVRDPSDLNYFHINPDSGWIRLERPLDRTQYHLQAIATDRGSVPRSATVGIVIEIVDRANNPPVWDQPVYGPVTVKENIKVGETIQSVRASSGIPDNPTVFYTLIRGSTDHTNKRDHFYLTQRAEDDGTWADIKVNYPLDYEKLNHYNLTVRVENNGVQQLASECTVFVVVEDVNDEIPLFIEREQETVLEGMPPGTKVTQVEAVDRDGTKPFNQVFYSIEPSKDSSDQYFTIDRETGEIYTKQEFDREVKQAYAVLVRAYDGAPSSRPGSKQGDPNSVTKYIRIGIGDKNDNPPYFDQALYEAEVNEDEDMQHTVITVTARDKDESSKIRYEITDGNPNGHFGVRNETGAIYVAGNLDYETKKEYNLTLAAHDTYFEGKTIVRIRVKDINDIAPKFEQSTYTTTIPEEMTEGLPRKILQVTATDGDEDREPNIVYFLTGQGITDSKDSSDRKFEINQTSGEIYVLKPLDRDLPKGRSQWRFTVYAQDEGGNSNGLVGYSEVVVNLKDINDNAPFFPLSTYTGNVTENGTAGMNVMTITATDYDDPNESNHAKLKYSIEQNQVNENGELIFNIDEDTGVISTAVCCLDRETNPEYSIKVVAVDGGLLKGTGTVTIKIKDINDMPPEFTKKEWFVEVDETEGDQLPEFPILVVSVNDGDLLETNRFNYKVEDNQFGADKFTMVTNSDGTGSLKVAKPLDYEDPRQRYGFNITITVSDHGGETSDPSHMDRARVFIRPRDVNDNKPEFEKSNIEVTVVEDSAVGTKLAKFVATDADQGGKSKVRFMIDRSSDKKRQFEIDQEGIVKLQRTLDREDVPRHHVKILAIDDGTPSKTATATLTVIVGDINDNAPRFLRDYRPVIMEHEPPQKVEEILATDDDDRSKGNGPPYTFRLDPNAPEAIKSSFEVNHDPHGANGDGMAVVRSKVKFDREEQKEYHIPIIIKDSGTPMMSATSILTVIIGDINDNKMSPGSKSIFVYNFKGQSPPTEIGRVHVEDKDDWDLPDKTFFFEEPHENFAVDMESGMITMKNVSEGEYFLKFRVYDRKHTQEVSANVTVIVKDIPEEAIHKSGSLRISGATAEDFIRTFDWQKPDRPKSSMYDRFKNALSVIMKTKIENIDVFSVITRRERPPITDIRFSVHGSPYYESVYLDGTVAVNRDHIEREVGINITMVGIDECLIEGYNCEGSCTNELKVDRVPVVVNSNRTAFVGVNVWLQPRCTCGARDFSEPETCRKYPPPCANGGKCLDSAVGALCRCPNGYDGPQCQVTTRTFNGNGWAWFPPLQQCQESHLGLDFMAPTSAPNGLIFYNGPIVRPDIGVVVTPDFVSLELFNGFPRLLIDFGSGTTEVTVKPYGDLNDGEWHHIDIFWDKETVRLMVDYCSGVAKDVKEPSFIDRSRCENVSSIIPFNEFLNVNSPLQLGGMYKLPEDLDQYFNWYYKPTRIGFTGCIKNFIHNSQMYDLGSPGSLSNSQIGCQPARDRCDSNPNTRNCGSQGTCLASYHSARCLCKPGYYGSRCDKQTQSKMFQHSSYIKYALSFEPDPFKTDIQLDFRTRQKHGELFRATSKHGREYAILEIKDKKLRFRFNLNALKSSEERELWLPNITVSDGQWHTVQVLRFGSTASISLDGGGGRRFNEITEYRGLHQLMLVERQSVVVGGDVQYVGPGVTVVDNDFHEGCMNDIRLDQRYLPMENGSENAAVVESRSIIDGCPSNNPCQGIHCQKPFVCYDLWMVHECRCPSGLEPTGHRLACQDVDECINQPCGPGGKCYNLEDGYGWQCRCPEGFLCTNCSCYEAFDIIPARSFGMTSGAIAIILACLFAYLILVLLILTYSRTRRTDQKFGHGDLDDDVRENIINYDDEGGGEDDMNAYDITPLRIPIDPSGLRTDAKGTLIRPGRQRPYPPGAHPDIGDFIQENLNKVDSDPNAPPFDDLRNYAYEGCGSNAGSLSSLASAAEDNEQDFDYLNAWGPRFQNLARMYQQGESEIGD
ncbi:neural cadherin isoform X1 [Brevipalpus obovatus]|uniref:neural cadherin isoform X1 n=1 Tax=Brevipalpus obovatus TaxID=246614 RepID=UPI003D9DC2C2